MSLRNIRMTLAYDGTDFYGFQVQKRGRTVQGEVESALAVMHRRQVRITAAGRTDSGVHANGQCINFYTDIDSISGARFTVALNSNLPPDIAATESEVVDDSFHARYDAVARVYKYYLLPSSVPVPRFRRYAYRLVAQPDVARLNRMAACLVGEHDFTALASAGEEGGSMTRVVHQAAFYPEGPFLVFRIAANGFLWKMVRSALGTILTMQDRGEDAFREVISARDRALAGPTAPPWGLFLHKVIYDEKESRFTASSNS